MALLARLLFHKKIKLLLIVTQNIAMSFDMSKSKFVPHYSYLKEIFWSQKIYSEVSIVWDSWIRNVMCTCTSFALRW